MEKAPVQLPIRFSRRSVLTAGLGGALTIACGQNPTTPEVGSSAKKIESVSTPSATHTITLEAVPTVTSILTRQPVATEAHHLTATPEATPTIFTREYFRKKYKKEGTLPTDVMRAEELERKFKTKIWNIEGTELHLRRGIKDLPVFKQLATTSVARLDIVLVDEAYIISRAISQQVRNALPDMYKTLEKDEEIIARDGYNYFKSPRERAIAERVKADGIAQCNELLKNGAIDRTTFDAYMEAYADYVRPFKENPTEFDIYHYSAGIGMALFPPEGRGKDAETNAIKLNGRYYILLAVGEKDQKRLQINRLLGWDRAYLDPDESFPAPEDFRLTTQNDTVFIGPATPGIALMHEFEHLQSGMAHDTIDLGVNGYYSSASYSLEQGDDSKYIAAFKTPRGIVIA